MSGGTDLTCKNCGKSFSAASRRGRKQLYCSPKCVADVHYLRKKARRAADRGTDR